ncbi:hypothetical protein [Haloglomus halophilum]|uniref:hypothetical protein n=1 Tax=Haloglomus halophilum TaxID=2962672 RepID=UPI0020C9AC4C|nr:hypothetical protein [Haloglomus halophilum]
MQNLSDRQLAFLQHEMESVIENDNRSGADQKDAREILTHVTDELHHREDQLLA